MSPGNPCRHLLERGCGIYEQRPYHPCRTFHCGWVQPDSPLPDEMRPDLSGVIVSLDQRWKNWRIIKAIAAGPRIPESSMKWLQQFSNDTRTPMLVLEFVDEDGRYVGEHKWGFGPPEFNKAVRESVEAEAHGISSYGVKVT
ncbi:MAG: hypothetical protein R3348_01260 [Xanthomonadales bacterium]|nr:hypothetical protein [Xanthomonadales bacterium]